MKNQTTGQRGEDRAGEFLEKRGWKIVERNYRCRWGEVDLVAFNGKQVMMVEVKARSSQRFGLPAEAIGRMKLKRMERVALTWIKEREVSWPVGLGVVTILGEGEPELISEIETVD
ncbi:MAG: YraN family protein [Patescibacteria group bacterium]|jgi:putative endonuclease